MRKKSSAVDPKLHAILQELSDEHRTKSEADAITETDAERLSRHLPRYTVAEPTLQESRALVERIRPLLRENRLSPASDEEAAAYAAPESNSSDEPAFPVRSIVRFSVEPAAPARNAHSFDENAVSEPFAHADASSSPMRTKLESELCFTSASESKDEAQARFSDRLREAAGARHSAFGTIIRYAAVHAKSFPWMFWGLSAFAVFLGVLASPVATSGVLGGEELHTNVLIVLVPLLAGLSVSYSFRSFGTPMFELELSFPMTPMQWLLGRLTVIVFYQAGLALAASFVLNREWLNESLPAFVISWLVPLGLYCAGTLALTLRFGTWYGTLIMAALWIGQIPLQQHVGPLYFISDSNHPHWAASKIIALLLTLLLAADVIRQFRKQRAGQTALLRGTER